MQGCIVWIVILTPRFETWLNKQNGRTQEKILAALRNLEVLAQDCLAPMPIQ